MALSQEPHFPFSSQFMPRMLYTTGTKKGSRHIPGHFSKHHHHTKLFETDMQGVPKKNYTLFWRAVAPLNFELGIKVGGVLEFSGSQL